MSADFTVIQAVRQRFGDETAEFHELLVEQEAPFVGKSKDFPFSCPNVAQGEVAVLHFQSLGVTAHRPRNILQINGVNISGGITPGPLVDLSGSDRLPLWGTHSLLVAANVLREENVLHIESVALQIHHIATLDNFIIDNVVVFFKTRAPVVGGSRIGPS